MGERRKRIPAKNAKLAKLRLEEKCWSQEELARKAEISAQTVRKAERGEPVSPISASRIARALGVPMKELFGEEG